MSGSSSSPFSSDASPTWSFSNQTMSVERNRTGLLGSLKNKLAKTSISNDGAQYSAPPPTRRPDRPGMNAFTTPSNEPPPAYTANPSTSQYGASGAPPYSPADVGQRPIHNESSSPRASAAPAAGPIVTSTADDQYAFLNTFDTVFLIDDSGSMAGRSWRETSHALEAIAPICTAHDDDGIDIYFLNAKGETARNVTDATRVHEVFQKVKPQGGTMTGTRVNTILKEYMERYEANPDSAVTKPLNLIVITDGEASDDLESVIAKFAQKLDKLDADPWQVGIQLFQVGEEPGAREYLQMLDDELAQDGTRDMVDTVPFVPGHRGRGSALTADDILKVVLGAVNRRLDRRGNNRT